MKNKIKNRISLLIDIMIRLNLSETWMAGMYFTMLAIAKDMILR